MKKLFLTLSLGVPLLCFSQGPGIIWQKTYGGTGLEQVSLVRPTMDGGYVVVGTSGSSDGDVSGANGGNDHWVVKLTPTGTIQWQNALGSGAGETGYDVFQTADSGYVFAGSCGGNSGDVSGNHGSVDYWMGKLNSQGVLQWQKAFGGSSVEIGFRVHQTLDGGFAMTGLSATSNGSGDAVGTHYGGQDFWFVKTDASGNIQWQKKYGGSGTEQSYDFLQNTDSTYVICGLSGSSAGSGLVTNNFGSNDYWVVKISPSGNVIWDKNYGGSGSDRPFSIAKTNDGGYILNGTTNSTDSMVTNYHGGAFDYWVIKIDGNGVLQWQRTLGGSGEDFGKSVQQTADGGYLVAGRTESTDGDVTGNHGMFDYWLVKLDATGSNVLWQRCYGGSANESAPPTFNVFMNAMEMADGTHLMAGYTYSTDGDVVGNVSTTSTDDNFWVVKMDACPLTLTSSATASICPGDTYQFGTQLLTAAGTYTDTTQSIHGCDSIITLQLSLHPATTTPVIGANGSVLSTGTYAGYQWNLNGQPIPNADDQNLTITGGGSYTVTVTDANGCSATSAPFLSTMGVTEFSSGTVSIYPNPTTSDIVISLPAEMEEITVLILNLEGKILLSKNYASSSTISLSLQDFKTGIYFVKIMDKQGNFAVKEVVKN